MFLNFQNFLIKDQDAFETHPSKINKILITQKYCKKLLVQSYLKNIFLLCIVTGTLYMHVVKSSNVAYVDVFCNSTHHLAFSIN